MWHSLKQIIQKDILGEWKSVGNAHCFVPIHQRKKGTEDKWSRMEHQLTTKLQFLQWSLCNFLFKRKMQTSIYSPSKRKENPKG